MEKLDKVMLIREKCGVSYQDAREALEACDYDVLDAIIWLERAGKTAAQTASYATTDAASSGTSIEMKAAQEEYRQSSKETKFSKLFSSFWDQLCKLVRAGLDMTFIAERGDERILAIPVLFVVIGLLIWGVSLWLMILGLFFGFRYRIEGASPVTVDVNDAMDKAADAAESIKSDFTKTE